MAGQTVKIVINAENKAGKAIRSVDGDINKLDKSSNKFVKTSKLMNVGALALTGVLAGLAVGFKKGMQATIEFEQRLSDVSTLLEGDSTEAINQFRDGIHELMKEIPKSADELGASAYAIVSAGITDTADALTVLRSSGRLAVAGLGSTEEATTLMVLAMNNFRDSGIDAEKAANLMFKTVRAGITNVSELSRSFGLVAPLAVEAGISLEELQAATAALTQVNKSASISQNSLKAVLISLAKPTKEATELFTKLGVTTFSELIEQTGGMVAALNAMKEASNGDAQAFARAMGSGEGLAATLSLLGSQSEAFATALESMKSGTDDLTVAVNKQNEQFTQQWMLLKGQVNVEFQKLAIKILPALIKIMEKMPLIVDSFIVVPFKGVVDVLSNVILKVINTINAIKKLINELKTLGKQNASNGGGIGGFLKGVGSNFNQRAQQNLSSMIPGFADGGVVGGSIGQPQLAMVHGGETILPTHKRGGAGGITINVNNPTLLDSIMVENLSMQLASLLRDSIRV